MGVEYMRHGLVAAMKRDLDRFFHEIYGERVLDAEKLAWGMGKQTPRRRAARRRRATRDDALDTAVVQELVDRVYRLGLVFGNPQVLNGVRLIQAWFRRARRFLCTNNTDPDLVPEHREEKLMRRGGVPICCPISLSGIPVDRCVRLVSASGTVEAYDVKVLSEYLLDTRNFQSPTTRTPILRYMVARVIVPKAITARVYRAQQLPRMYDNRAAFVARQNERADQLLGLERTCTEVFAQAVDICEGSIDNDGNNREAVDTIETDILPTWRDYVWSYMSLDRQACLAMLKVEESRMVNIVNRRGEAGCLGYLLAQVREYLVSYSRPRLLASLRLPDQSSRRRRISLLSRRQIPMLEEQLAVAARNLDLYSST